MATQGPADVRKALDGITATVIGGAQRVSSRLGCGFLEKVYENALVTELDELGLSVAQQQPVDVFYKGSVVGTYVADLLVEDAVIVEVKAVECLNRVHHAQCLNYLRATDLRVALLLNFGRRRLEFRRVVHNF